MRCGICRLDFAWAEQASPRIGQVQRILDPAIRLFVFLRNCFLAALLRPTALAYAIMPSEHLYTHSENEPAASPASHTPFSARVATAQFSSIRRQLHPSSSTS